MREEEKILSGILFNPGDPELKALKLRSHRLSAEYSRSDEAETEYRSRLLRQLLAAFGEGKFSAGTGVFPLRLPHKDREALFLSITI